MSETSELEARIDNLKQGHKALVEMLQRGVNAVINHVPDCRCWATWLPDAEALLRAAAEPIEAVEAELEKSSRPSEFVGVKSHNVPYRCRVCLGQGMSIPPNKTHKNRDDCLHSLGTRISLIEITLR